MSDFTSEVLAIEGHGPTAVLWLDRPEARNAMGPQFWSDLPRAMAQLGGDEEVRAVIIAARGSHFSAAPKRPPELTLDDSDLSGAEYDLGACHDEAQVIHAQRSQMYGGLHMNWSESEKEGRDRKPAERVRVGRCAGRRRGRMYMIISGKVTVKFAETALTAEGIKTKLAELLSECNSSIPDSARIKRNLRDLLPYYKVQR